ncbi:FRG domain-containing protein [Photobacterium sp. J15]|uniref:FRG domain-containing protein n=1 Tax=Photobacterium sp. J15 TaxID=265901 RepID=UPI0007E3BD45|nr:FRG domain-containing protein [Photobacterium sp. J15]
MFPSFDYRQWYQTDVTTLGQVEKLFLDVEPDDELYFRGMANYDFVCISTFYRYFINSRQLKWSEKDVGFKSMVLLPEIDMEEYKSLSFRILDDFYDNLLTQGSKELSLDTIAYLAQHYGLPTDLIDFSYDPKIALYFACCEMPEHDCSVYMFDIYARVKEMMQLCGSGRIGYFCKPDGTLMNEQEREQHAKQMCTELDRDGLPTITPIIAIDDIKYGQRILNQKGAFIYHRNSVPMDQLMYTASTHTSYQGRRVYKISKELKPSILQTLDEKYEINESFVYPSLEADQNLEIIEKAVAKTKENFGL